MWLNLFIAIKVSASTRDNGAEIPIAMVAPVKTPAFESNKVCQTAIPAMATAELINMDFTPLPVPETCMGTRKTGAKAMEPYNTAEMAPSRSGVECRLSSDVRSKMITW